MFLRARDVAKKGRKMNNKVPTMEEIKEALKLRVEIDVRHDALGRVIRKKNYSDVTTTKKVNQKKRGAR